MSHKTAAVLCTLLAFAVITASVRLVAQTPAPATPAPATAKPAEPRQDWGGLARFEAANAAVPAPVAGENRVVFMGDSITDFWHLDGPEGFAGKHYINRGTSGQITSQMLLRFRQDVVDLHPSVVVLLAGTNDLARNQGYMSLEQTENNLASMADLAVANHIRVVLCSVLPAFDFPWHKGLNPAPTILELNAWIKKYAADKGYIYVDYHTAMKDKNDGLAPELAKDGVHPTPAGYTEMAPLAEAGIEKALAQ